MQRVSIKIVVFHPVTKVYPITQAKHLVLSSIRILMNPVPNHMDGSVLWTCILTYLLTPWCRVLLGKLTGLQLVKKFPAFYGTRRFITAFTCFRHPSLSCANPIQSTCPQPTSWRSILILSTHLSLGLPSGLFPSGFPTRTLYAPSPPPYELHAQPISFFSILSPAQYWVRSTDHLAPCYSKCHALQCKNLQMLYYYIIFLHAVYLISIPVRQHYFALIFLFKLLKM